MKLHKAYLLYRKTKDVHLECGICGMSTTSPHVSRAFALNIHHITPTRMGGGNENENLALICRSCHAAVHSFYESAAYTHCHGLDKDFFQKQYRLFALAEGSTMVYKNMKKRVSYEIPVK